MNINEDLIHFIVTVTLSFLVGLEIKTYHLEYHKEENEYFFGTARTFTFMGMLGFLFYKIDPDNLLIYALGFIGFNILYILFYIRKLSENKPSILIYLVFLTIYALGPVSILYPVWMSSLVFVLIVFILNAKNVIKKFSIKINTYEFETLSKMILLSAVILPLLPKQNVISYIPVSPFKIWLAVVIISAISYGGYIAQKYLFHTKGFFLTGIIGGVYSSTATTVVLSRKAKEIGKNNIIDASIIAATSVMYLRLTAVAMIFNVAVAKKIAFPFIFLAVTGFLISLFLMLLRQKERESLDFVDKNPLELGTAFVFAFLFVAMIMLTHFVIEHYGSSGLEIFSFLVGLTDIDPFILSLLTGKYMIVLDDIVKAIMIAAGSNNLIKAVYALYFGGWKNCYRSAFWIILLGVGTVIWAIA